jgi:hypothetical protein
MSRVVKNVSRGSRVVKNVSRGSRVIPEVPIPAATWRRVVEAAQAYDALPPELRQFSIHHPNIKKLRG